MLNRPTTELNASLKKSATTIQRFFRGYKDREKYTVNQLPKENLTQYFAFLKSVGPNIQGLENYKASHGKRSLLVATCSFAPIEVLAELSIDNARTHVPQLIIIDNNFQSGQFWRLFKSFITSTLTLPLSTQTEQFLRDNKKLISPRSWPQDQIEKLVISWSSNILDTFRKYGYSYIRSIVMKSVYYEDDWGYKDTFIKIKNIIDKNEIECVYAYPSNIPFLCSEDKSKSIIENVAILKPKLAIYANYSPAQGTANKLMLLDHYEPQAVMTILSKEIDLETHGITQLAILDMRIYQLDYKQKIDSSYRQLQEAITKMIRKNRYPFKLETTPFLADLIFKMAGSTIELSNFFYTPSQIDSDIVFYLPITDDEAVESIKKLHNVFPMLESNFPQFGEPCADDLPFNYPVRIVMDMDALQTQVLPLMPAYLNAHPELLSKYENGFEKILNSFSELFAKFKFSTQLTDCFEESLCALVTNYLKVLNISDHNLRTTNGCFAPCLQSFNKTNIYLSTPISSAQHIADYFNKIQAGSATMAEQQEFLPSKNAILTKITVDNKILTHESFLKDLEDTIKHLPEEQVNIYLRQSEPELASTHSFRM